MWANLIFDRQSIMVGQAQEPDEAMCAHGSPEQVAYWKDRWSLWKKNEPGSGMLVYVKVPEVDEYYETVKGKGAEPHTPPISQFYGIRDFVDAEPGQLYCGHCVDESGKLRPYEAILEGSIQGYFMGMKKMSRDEAEPAAREHLAKMPAWQGRG